MQDENKTLHLYKRCLFVNDIIKTVPFKVARHKRTERVFVTTQSDDSCVRFLTASAVKLELMVTPASDAVK
jgi:hypothetical protein